MKRGLFFLIGILAVALMVSACKKPQPKPDQSVLEAFDKKLVAQTNQLGFALYKNLSQQNRSLMISPVSISLAMAMTYNGAAGQTSEEMARALKLEGVELQRLNENNQALIYLLSTADTGVTLNIADSIWIKKGLDFSDTFLGTVETNYQANAENLDFSNPKSADTINQWVSDQTEKKIDAIVQAPLDPEAVMFLINAVYFKGQWTHPFEKEQTSDQAFQTADNQSVMVPMMFQSGDFKYLKTSDFQAIRLPYGEDEQLAMYLFLPDEKSGITQFIEGMNQETWENWQSLFEEKTGRIILPRFTMEYETSLNQPLTELGMGVAFEAGKADFSGMTENSSTVDLHINEVKHKTYIQVDESGMEAAAATSVEIGLTSMPMNDFELTFNRPFCYLIEDRDTGAIVFMGTVMDPSEQ